MYFSSDFEAFFSVHDSKAWLCPHHREHDSIQTIRRLVSCREFLKHACICIILKHFLLGDDIEACLILKQFLVCSGSSLFIASLRVCNLEACFYSVLIILKQAPIYIILIPVLPAGNRQAMDHAELFLEYDTSCRQSPGSNCEAYPCSVPFEERIRRCGEDEGKDARMRHVGSTFGCPKREYKRGAMAWRKARKVEAQQEGTEHGENEIDVRERGMQGASVVVDHTHSAGDISETSVKCRL